MNFPSRIYHYGTIISRTRSRQLESLRRLSTMATTKVTPKGGPPSPSASLVIVNSQNEVLLVQRNPKASTFAGFHVCRPNSQQFRDLGLSRFSQVETQIRKITARLLLQQSAKHSKSPGYCSLHRRILHRLHRWMKKL